MTKKCFVVQGFGRKTDLETKRSLDLNSSYDMIKEAVINAGIDCVQRADEILLSGQIVISMYKQLYEADLVIADLSTANLNAAFELGVRYALKRRATIVVAEEGFKTPFNIGQINILRYKHNGDDVPRIAAREFQSKLVDTIKQIMESCETDSPVYCALPSLQPPDERNLATQNRPFDPPQDRIDSTNKLIVQPIPSSAHNLDLSDEENDYQDVVRLKADGINAKHSDVPASEFLDNRKPFLGEQQKLAESAMRSLDFATAVLEWEKILKDNPNDTYAIRQLALAIAMAKSPTPEDALFKAKQVLQERKLLASTSDPDTFSLWGFLCRNLWNLHKDLNDLTDSIHAYQRAFSIRQAYRDGITLSILLEIRSQFRSDDQDEKTADKIIAKRIRAEVIHTELCRIDEGSADEEKRLRVFQLLWLAAKELTNTKPIESGASEVNDPNRSYQAWMMAFYDELRNLLSPPI